MGLFGFTPDSTTTEENLRQGIAKTAKGASPEEVDAMYEAFCERVEQKLRDQMGARYAGQFGMCSAVRLDKMTPLEQESAKAAKESISVMGSQGHPKRWEIVAAVAQSYYGSMREADKTIKPMWESFKAKL